MTFPIVHRCHFQWKKTFMIEVPSQPSKLLFCAVGQSEGPGPGGEWKVSGRTLHSGWPGPPTANATPCVLCLRVDTRGRCPPSFAGRTEARSWGRDVAGAAGVGWGLR